MLIARLTALSVLLLGDKFTVGDWVLTGPDISGTGAPTGVIGGSANQNELEELRALTATVPAGPPPGACSLIIDAGPPECSITFSTPGLRTDADIGVASGSTTADIGQDIGTAFGLGDDQALAYGRVTFDMGLPTVTVSGFVFDDPLGPAAISPGVAADYLDFNFQVTKVNGLASELVEIEAPVPLGVLRDAADIGIFSGMAEVGDVEADIDDVTATFIDIDAMVTLHATEQLDLWVGYRHPAIDGDGVIDDDTFHADIRISGIMLGGGVRF